MRCALIALILALPLAANAGTPVCWLIGEVAAADVSSGTTTTAAFAVTPGGSRPNASTPNPAYLAVMPALVDANNGVSNVVLSFTAAQTLTGTYAAVPLCANAAPLLTCDNARVGWDPQTYGKNWWVKPVDWGYPYGKITATLTGHGAGDTLALSIYGCQE